MLGDLVFRVEMQVKIVQQFISNGYIKGNNVDFQNDSEIDTNNSV